MPAAPVHHTPIDSTKPWDGPAAEKSFDKKEGDFVKFYAWIDEGEGDSDADGTDKEDGWGPHHDIDAQGVPGDANEKGFQAAMGALNGAHGNTSVIPDADRQGVWDHLAAHYKDAGIKEADIPALRSAGLAGETRAEGDANVDMPTGGLPSYEPIPYRVDPDEIVTCPHCQLKNDTDARYCDQCGTELAGRTDVQVQPDPNVVPDEGEGTDEDGSSTVPLEPVPYEPHAYDEQADETVQCPNCEKMNDPDAKWCDQCGTYLVGRSDVKINGPVEDVTPGNRSARRDAAPTFPDDRSVCMLCQNDNDMDANYCDQCGQPMAEDAAENASELDEDADSDPTGAEEDANPGYRSRQSSDGPPRENLIRMTPGRGVMLRSIDGDDPLNQQDGNGSLLFGHFSVFNEWYEIDSFWEGQFLESIAPGAFEQTIKADAASMRVLFDHGFDPQLGDKPLGPITALREDDIGAYYEVPLLDTDYNRNFVLPALQGRLMSGQQVGSQLGASFRFMVLAEEWNQRPDPSAYNQLGIPERVITRAQVLEFGPVTFPANPGASSGVRSRTDELIDHLHHDPRFLARFTDRCGAKVVEKMLETMPVGDPAERRHEAAQPAKRTVPDRPKSTTRSLTQRMALLRLHGIRQEQ